MSEILDSGNRREFETGAVRDIQEGKGRCDLLPVWEVGNFLNDEILIGIYMFMKSKDTEYLENAVSAFIDLNYAGNFPAAMLELAKHYEQGALKYGERNWEKGIPLHCYIDSGIRHYLKHQSGFNDEPHDRAFLFNMFGAMWTVHTKPELIDIPDIE